MTTLNTRIWFLTIGIDTHPPQPPNGTPSARPDSSVDCSDDQSDSEQSRNDLNLFAAGPDLLLEKAKSPDGKVSGPAEIMMKMSC
jgi:hypothetical protein